MRCRGHLETDLLGVGHVFRSTVGRLKSGPSSGDDLDWCYFLCFDDDDGSLFDGRSLVMVSLETLGEERFTR